MSAIPPDVFAARMLAIRDSDRHDPEEQHILADKLLCEVLQSLGYAEGVKMYNDPTWTRWYA